MKEEAKIRRLLYQFEHAGLIARDINLLLGCFAKDVIGIGLGEQGFVTCLQDICDIFETGLKPDRNIKHTLSFGRTEVLEQGDSAFICAEVRITSQSPDEEEKVLKSQFQQSLMATKEGDDWKICGLHASAPVITEEFMDSYPLHVDEKTLQSLREKIGEQAYLAEEQYRQAILADTVAFYIVNFTTDCFEKCQVQSDLCVYVDSGTPYETLVKELAPKYLIAADREAFVSKLSLENIQRAFAEDCGEISCEYRMYAHDDRVLWMRTIIRLITDAVSGDRKGIMYVKNIDFDKRAALEIQEKVDYDGMTRVLNKAAFTRETDALMQQSPVKPGGTFLMIDVDDFKGVNDTFGHPTGDRVLVTIAQLLRDTFDADSRVGRLGGDEFAVFLPGHLLNAQLKSQINHLLEQVRQIRFPDCRGLMVSISIGVSYLETGTFDDFYQETDCALYRAKKLGKDGVSFISRAGV